jgi:hypothetical protein
LLMSPETSPARSITTRMDFGLFTAIPRFDPNADGPGSLGGRPPSGIRTCATAEDT